MPETQLAIPQGPLPCTMLAFLTPLQVGCNISVESRKQLQSSGGSDAVRELAVFKKWHVHTAAAIRINPLMNHRHGIRHNNFRETIVHALNLGTNPTNAETRLLFIQLKQKPNHSALAPGDKYSLDNGFDLTFAEALDMLSRQPPAVARFNDLKAKHEYMKAKGGLGMSILLLKCGSMVDMVDVILPTAKNAIEIQQKDPWGDEWVSRFSVLLGFEIVAYRVDSLCVSLLP